MTVIVILLLAYFLGSIPFGFLISKFWLGLDIREHGSGNIGMTNVMRVAGKLPGILTFILDFLKGSVGVIIGIIWLSGSTEEPLLSIQLTCVGIVAVLGHVFSPFLKFKGGKGISTTFGILAVLDFSIGLMAGFIWGGVFLAKRISSLAALVMLGSLPLLALLIPWIMGNEIYFSKIALYGGLSALLIYRHRENIERLLKGNEKALHATQKP